MNQKVLGSCKPFAIVIFGASGDLTARKLVPALYNLFREKRLPEAFQVVGFARRPKSDAEFRDEMKVGVEKFSRTKLDSEMWASFQERIYYVQGEFGDEAAYRSLKARLEELPGASEIQGHYLHYLATAPEFFGPVATQLKSAGLIEDSPHPPQKLVVEKPFGTDLESAQRLNCELQDAIPESGLYRIDHYLGKETVQNLIYFRFANAIYEPLWNRGFIDHIQFTVAEQEGVGTRGGYYDTSGALRDMVQNHMLQLLTLTTMEPPAALDSESLRDEKVKVLRSITNFERGQLQERVIRAQYEGYKSEDRVAKDSRTETYVVLKLQIDNWRWSGVPLFLRTGKALPRRTSEIAVVFRRPPEVLFQAKYGIHLSRNTLRIRLQPDEGIHLCFNAKTPGDAEIQTVDMDFRYGGDFGSYSPEAYERLLHDALIGDSTLFTRADEVQEAWRIIDSVQKQWSDLPMHLYARGSWGPEVAQSMMATQSNRWLTEASA